MSGTHVTTPTRTYGAQSVNTTAINTSNEFHGGASRTVGIQLGTGGSVTSYIAAPCDGAIESITMTSKEATTTAAIKTMKVTSLGTIAAPTATAAVAAIQTTALGALTPGNLTLSTTKTNLNVEQGQLLKCEQTIGGTLTTATVGALSVKFIEAITNV